MSELLVSRRPRASRRSILATVVLAALVLFFVVPLLYLVSVSLMGRNETGQGVLIPAVPQFSNWAEVLTQSDLLRGIANSLIAAIGGAVVSLLIALPGAWAMVRFRTGGATLAGTIMSPWLLPPIVAVVPLFTLLRLLGANNTLWGLTLVYALVNVPVAIWLLEGFLRKLPIEIEEAARIDGAGSVRVLVSVVAPLVAPALVAVGIIAGVLNYNEFLLATFLTQSPDARTLPVVLSLFYGERTPHVGKIAAASVIGVIPVFAAAVFLQRWLVGGLTSGAVR
ncbi:carbohydrate ABC transporter permease [Microbacterium sp. CIAB417]|uniref:carbohydrate ABC transporter permease n=1 Tax=Microbacterium sp. CIAB417 TaxID=2860287 RepID=UPI001FAE691B|nr:carbohydrate ABC transporter permease [Microbacterium sp. CIAB417]